MKKIIFDAHGYFDVEATVECGQVFRYNKLSKGKYEVFSLDKYAVVMQLGDSVSIESADIEYFSNYFDLQTDYNKLNDQLIEAGLPSNVCQYAKGIRILRQDAAETIFSFIISANNNITRIKSIIERICTAIGSRTEYGHAFPTVRQWASQGADFYANCGAGYRASYLHKTANALLDCGGEIALEGMPASEARDVLTKLSGVGPKVADCILLFGYHYGNVVPVDTWIKKVYHNYYEEGHRDKEIASFFVNKWLNNAGLAQQYLFYFERKDRQN